MVASVNSNDMSIPTSESVNSALPAVKLSMGLGGLVLVLLSLEPALFYEIMTAHGAGMVGTAALTGAAIMWFFLARHVELTGAVYWLMLALFLLGVALVLG